MLCECVVFLFVVVVWFMVVWLVCLFVFGGDYLCGGVDY